MKNSNAYFKLTTGRSLASGFTLIEAMVALVILGVIFAFAMPVFLYSQMRIIRSHIQSGALIVTQRVFDNIRTQKLATLPTAGTVIVVDPDILKVGNRTYSANVIFCGSIGNICNNEQTQFKLEITYNGEKIYDLQGTYTEIR